MYIKNKILSNIVQILSLVIVIIFSIFILKPAKDKLENEILEKRDEIIGDIEQDLGLKIKYGSISPIIVNSIVIKDISISSLNGNNLVDLSSVTVNFSFFNMVISKWKKVDIPSIISSIYLNKGKVKLDFEDNSFFENFKGNGKPSYNYFKGRVFFNEIDVDLNFRLLSIEAHNTKGNLYGFLSRYNVNLETNAKYTSKLDNTFQFIESSFQFNGNFSRTFKEIKSSVYLKDIKSSLGIFNDLDLNLTMFDKELNIETFDSEKDLNIKYILRIPILESYFEVTGSDINITDILRPSNNFTVLDNFINSSFTGKISGSHLIKYGTLLYSIKGNLDHFQDSHSLSISSEIDAVGDLDNITFNDLQISTNLGYLGFVGKLDLHNFYPEGSFYLRNGQVGENIILDSDFRVKVINDNFINLNFDYIESQGIKVSNISSIIYMGSNEISFQGLKKDENGEISISGNYNKLQKSISSSISINELNLKILESIIPLPIFKQTISDSFLTLDANIDFFDSNLNYNLNSFIIENKINDSKVLIDGSGSNYDFNIDYLNVELPDLSLEGRIKGYYINDKLELLVDSLINDNKYTLDIEILDNIIKGTGNFGLDFSLSLGDTMYANFTAKDLPINYQDFKVTTSLDFKSAIFSDSSFLISVPNFEALLETSKLPFNPKISFSVDGSNDNININNVNYSDGFDPLKGNINLKRENTGFYSVLMNLSGQSNEEIGLKTLFNSNLSNINLSLDIDNFLLDRLYIDGIKGMVSNNIDFNGNLNEFSILGSLKSDNLSILKNSATVDFNYKISDKLLSISDLKSSLNNNILTLPILTYNFTTGNLLGRIGSNFKMGELDGNAELALDFSFKPLESILKINSETFSTFNGKLSLLDVRVDNETLFENKIFRIFNNNSALQIYSVDRNLKFLYSYDSGLINGKISKPYAVAMTLLGTFNDGELDLSVSDLNLDASIVDMFINVGSIDSLDLHGQLSLKGPVNNPLINGLLWADMDLSLDNIPDKIEPIRLNIRAVDSYFSILNSSIIIGDSGQLNLEGSFLIDSWTPEYLDLYGSISLDNMIPIQYQYGQIIAETNIYTPQIRFYMDNSGSNISGKIVVQEGEYFTKILNNPEKIDKGEKDSPLGIEVDMTVEIGVNNKLYWPNKTVPVVDATLKSSEQINIKYKSITEEFNVTGRVSIINGEVDYSGNPFYLDEGSVDLNLSNDNIDPYIKILASKTVIDDDDKQVEVYLSFEGGFFSDFKPTFSSNDSSKTQEEVRSLIGLAFTSDSFGSLLFNVADEVATSYLTAPFEQSLKSLINVDDVEIKSGFISALLSNITNNSFDSTDESGYTVAEMFSDTSLTIGNFITDDLFGKVSIGSVYENSELQPDVNFGLTLYSPHFQLGFNLSPQLSDEYVFEPEIELSLGWVFTLGEVKEN